MGVFIRAPIVTEVGASAASIANYNGKVVGVLQGKRLGTSFHPELTDDRQLHEYFLQL
jgi:5'-phosphate synthase pdxT subunit